MSLNFKHIAKINKFQILTMNYGSKFCMRKLPYLRQKIIPNFTKLAIKKSGILL